MKYLKALFLLFLMGWNNLSKAASFEQNTVETLRSNNKLTVVIAVLITIFAGLLIFLISQEIRLRKLEKKIDQKPA